MKLTKEQTSLIQRLYDERITQAEKVALSEVSTTIVFNEVFPLVITKAAAYLDNGYILNPQACNHYQSSPFFEVSMFKPTSLLEQERTEAIAAASELLKLEITAEVQEIVRQKRQRNLEIAAAEQEAKDAITTEQAILAAFTEV
ncbi:hypothetical protein SS23_18920 [Enterobacter hormaechei subsp. steigerwaltii]|uniref:hypothetical protein n=1 Tax=Enterobacter cloacae complex TaxID=354276 RepID=UPI0005F1263F|nr:MULTISPECIES: hypothetical protein [Enterobacter cloacae complex]KJM56696.1 hypothetical protein SS23_18920 [Enterobacter hormaechei subsp. steigerwaltii]KLQ17291.1 hypothetical protein ABR35_05000 [Enterobacter cloacae subsp. cloacae]KYH15703.1 hypothetical protein A0133_12040 [Enterobacter hormaechei]MCE1583479.1 hypothetical protein [Enterobacter hormaechei]MDE7608120.1 hypothetical protein [Enterobacter hormaechei]